ncbi:hypothetical protein Tco_0497374 [Tanacetum coccineum]
MHLSQQQNNIISSPYSPNLPNTLNINQVERHVGYCPCCIFTQKQFLALSEDIHWIEFILTQPHPPPRVQRDYWKRIFKKMTIKQAKTDKTEHGKDKVKSKPKKGLKRQKEAKTIKNRQGTKETRARVKKQPEIKAGSARYSKKGSQRPKMKSKDH